MKTSEKGINLMHRFEGFRNRPYLCPAHIWTCGWGAVLYQEQIRLPVVRVAGKDIPMIRKEYPLRQEHNRVWSKEELVEMFKADLATFERGVLRLCPANLTPGRFDALVSFAFNVGLGNLQRSTIRMRHNRRDYAGAAEAFLMWTKAGGRVLPGLVRRRQDEKELYLS